MELLADRDPEEARKLLDPVLERMMEEVHYYEGTVNQVMGDGIMALFGAPLAHEDHAVRACYAALRMQESIRHYADGARHAHGVNVLIRVGLNSDEVVVRAIGSDLHMDYTAVGQTTHLAARMEQLASPGSILLTQATLDIVEGFVAVKPLGRVPVKGLADALEVYEVTGAGPARTRLQASARRGLTRFVGRDAELEQLRRAQQLAGEGHGQVAAVVGEAGVGKSRLVYEFTHSHRLHGWLVLESASVSYGKATSYLPVIELLKSYFKLQDRDDFREIREKVTGKLLTLDEYLKPTLPALLALLDVPVDDAAWRTLDPAQRRRRTFDAVKRLLLREARQQALLLIFEDLRRGAAGGAPRRRSRARPAQAAPGQARQPIHSGGDGPNPGGDAGVGGGARPVLADAADPGDPGPAHGPGDAGGAHRSTPPRGQTPAPGRR
jgi:class 3 adenylate cyclase